MLSTWQNVNGPNTLVCDKTPMKLTTFPKHSFLRGSAANLAIGQHTGNYEHYYRLQKLQTLLWACQWHVMTATQNSSVCKYRLAEPLG